MVCGYRPTPAGGGTEKHVYELTRGLLERGVHVEIICEDRPFLPDADNPLAPYIVGVTPASLRRPQPHRAVHGEVSRFSELIDPSRYDIVHCHGQYGYHIALRWTQLVAVRS